MMSNAPLLHVLTVSECGPYLLSTPSQIRREDFIRNVHSFFMKIICCWGAIRLLPSTFFEKWYRCMVSQSSPTKWQTKFERCKPTFPPCALKLTWPCSGRLLPRPDRAKCTSKGDLPSALVCRSGARNRSSAAAWLQARRVRVDSGAHKIYM